MANFHERLPNNVRGAFYVDWTCLDCDLCRNVAPNNFSRDAEHGVSYVSKQPDTPKEIAVCREAVEGCPCESIGSDGDRYDWDTTPSCRWPDSQGSEAPRRCGCNTKPNDNDTNVA
jgi:ferredoxin